MSDKPSSGTGIIAAILLVIVLLTTGYVGAYYAMLDGREVRLWQRKTVVEATSARTSVLSVAIVDPSYRIGDVGDYVFWPAHQVDRRMRPDYWSKLDPIDFDEFVPEGPDSGWE